MRFRDNFSWKISFPCIYTVQRHFGPRHAFEREKVDISVQEDIFNGIGWEVGQFLAQNMKRILKKSLGDVINSIRNVMSCEITENIFLFCHRQVFGSPSTPILENPEHQTRWYFKYFLGKCEQMKEVTCYFASFERSTFFICSVFSIRFGMNFIYHCKQLNGKCISMIK